jgi:hypothetical protein
MSQLKQGGSGGLFFDRRWTRGRGPVLAGAPGRRSCGHRPKPCGSPDSRASLPAVPIGRALPWRGAGPSRRGAPPRHPTLRACSPVEPIPVRQRADRTCRCRSWLTMRLATRQDSPGTSLGPDAVRLGSWAGANVLAESAAAAPPSDSRSPAAGATGHRPPTWTADRGPTRRRPESRRSGGALTHSGKNPSPSRRLIQERPVLAAPVSFRGSRRHHSSQRG